MTFRRFGRSLHLRIEKAEDLSHLTGLNEAHWVATGAPIETINCDRTFLGLADVDDNGRIQCFEIKLAITWLCKVLRDVSGANQGSVSLGLDAINTDDAEGHRIHDSATKMLARLGLPSDTRELTLEQVRRIKAHVESMPVSEAGVVLPEASDDPEVRQFVTDILATVGGAPHPKGQPGVGKDQLDGFLGQAQAWLDWQAGGEIPKDQQKTDIMPLGEATPRAFALLAGLKDKIDQYFAQCEAVAFDPRAAQHVLQSDAEMQALDLDDPQAIQDFFRNSPLATPREDRTLSFDAQINPWYAANLQRLRSEAITPALGQSPSKMSAEQWGRVKQFFAAHDAWSRAKAGPAVEPLGKDKLTAYLDPKYRDAVEAMIVGSAKTAFDLDNIRLTEKLILYQANLLRLANNFVSFPHLYDPGSRAMFEMGTLVMDGRRFNFGVRVSNRAQHSAVAKTGNMYVLYVEVAPPGGATKYEVAVPVTSGGMGNLCVGKRGIFQDIHGAEHDARVAQIIENPISVTEAILSPFKRLGRMLSGKIEAITSAAEKDFDKKTSVAVDQATKAPPAAQSAPAAPQNRGLMAGGLLMGGGVAVAALGSAVAYITKTLEDVDGWKIALTIALAVLAVLLPVAIIGLVKLRKRDLSAILEGSGWAINARMRLTLRQGRFFTQRPKYPKGARGTPLWWLWVLVGVGVLLMAAVAGFKLFRQ